MRPAARHNRRVRRVLGVTLVASLLATGALALMYSNQEPSAPKPPPQRPVAVRTDHAMRGALALSARYRGELDADAAQIAPRIGGLLEQVLVRIGDRVQAEQVLARVDTAQLQRQIAEVEAQRRGALASRERVAAELVAARAALDRSRPLLEKRLISPQDQEALRARVDALAAERDMATAQADEAKARKQLLQQQIADAQLVAPFDGAVAQRYLDAGAVVQPGTPVLQLVRSGPLRVRFRIPERDLGRVRVGQPFVLTTQATGETQYSGKVERIAAAVTREDRNVAVEGVLDARHDALRAGMYADITVQLGTIEDAWTLPGNAVLERPGTGGALMRGVFVVEDGLARWIPVRVVGREGDRLAIEGLPEGVEVITLGQERVREGSPVRRVGGES